MVPHRPTGLVRHLEPGRFEQLIASLDCVVAARAAGPGDHLVHRPAGAAGQRGRAAAAGRHRLAQRRGAGPRPQDRARCAAAAARRGGRRAGRLPAAWPPEHRAPGRCSCCIGNGSARRSAASIVGRAVDNALVRAGMDAPTRGANLLRHSLATDLLGRGRRPARDRRPVRARIAGHHPDLRRGRRRRVARGRAALAPAAGVVMTAAR